MSGALITSHEREPSFPSTDEILAVLSRALARRSDARIVDVERNPCPNGTSWWLEDITLHLDDRSRIALVFKDLVREANGSAARHVKPAFVSNPTREPWVYQHLLMDATPGPPHMWAALTDPGSDRYWLFLERVDGAPLSQIGDHRAWCAAAEWLGRFHATAPLGRAMHGPLLRHDREYHRRWMARALVAAQQDPEKQARLRALVAVHERAMETALVMGPSLIHGEFYPSNVLVEQCGGEYAVHAVDWEMAALGPPLLDLAALMSGRWSQSDRLAMAAAYRDGAASAGVRCTAAERLLLGAATCRLLLAIQWLGWSAEWTAPADHRNDWLTEAELCERELRG